MDVLAECCLESQFETLYVSKNSTNEASEIFYYRIETQNRKKLLWKSRML